jgi:demethylmenaquinone methyltransferase / 2-methoxy-6-polyprenyl-1,4-benzoquinol methylase
VLILEFSKPKNFPFKQLFNFYFYKILPFIGRLISKDKGAYKYLPESVDSFPDGDVFTQHLEKAGFVNCRYITLSLGIATIYIGEKFKLNNFF